jgi:hypothetical protein
VLSATPAVAIELDSRVADALPTYLHSLARSRSSNQPHEDLTLSWIDWMFIAGSSIAAPTTHVLTLFPTLPALLPATKPPLYDYVDGKGALFAVDCRSIPTSSGRASLTALGEAVGAGRPVSTRPSLEFREQRSKIRTIPALRQRGKCLAINTFTFYDAYICVGSKISLACCLYSPFLT